MRSELPKPLHPVAGKPMLGHLIDACFAGGIDDVLVVVGHGKEQVIAAFEGDERVGFAEQTEMLGTGHAVMACRKQLEAMDENEDVTILAGDLPLVTGDVLHTLRNAHRQDDADATLGTAIVDDPTGYGRVIRDGKGDFRQIVEQADATPEQAAVNEVFPSLYCVKAGPLLEALGELSTGNAQGEYYLTDIYALLLAKGRRVLAVEAVTADDIIAPNDRRQLAVAESVMQDRIHDALRGEGVTIVNGNTTHIEADVSVGSDTTIHPMTFIGRGSVIGAGCSIGPAVNLEEDSVVPDNTSLAGPTDSIGMNPLGS